jgi:hypothetical protein
MRNTPTGDELKKQCSKELRKYPRAIKQAKPKYRKSLLEGIDNKDIFIAHTEREITTLHYDSQKQGRKN